MNAKELWAAMREPHPQGNAPLGLCIRGRWSWVYKYEGDNVPVTSVLTALIKHGIVESSYYSGGRASVHLTAKGENPANCPQRSGWPADPVPAPPPTLEERVAGWEETAKRCGFEGVTEALGYLLTKWESENTASIGESERRVGMLPELAAPYEPQALSGCAVRAAIQRATVPDSWDFYGLPRTRYARMHTETGRGTAPVRYPVYLWRPAVAEYVVIDETRDSPSEDTAAFVCRIVESVEPLSLGHTIITIPRGELEPVGDDWGPL